MKPMITEKLIEIKEFIKRKPNFGKFQTNDDFMKYTIELCNYTRFLMVMGFSIGNIKKNPKGYTIDEAPIVGLMVRSYKLYDKCVYFISKRQGEISFIFSRMIIESIITMIYLISKGRTSIQSFRKCAYRGRIQNLKILEKKKTTQKLSGIEKRMIKNIITQIEEDGFTIKELMNNKNWLLDGKDFAQIYKDVLNNNRYSFGYGVPSENIHGGWHDLHQFYLIKDGDSYLPNPESSDPDPRYILPLTIICLFGLSVFMNWNETNIPEIESIISRLDKIVKELDETHEKYWNDLYWQKA